MTKPDVLSYLASVVRGETIATTAQLKAAELLGRHFGLWADKPAADCPIPVVISGADDLVDGEGVTFHSPPWLAGEHSTAD